MVIVELVKHGESVHDPIYITSVLDNDCYMPN